MIYVCNSYIFVPFSLIIYISVHDYSCIEGTSLNIKTYALDSVRLFDQMHNQYVRQKYTKTVINGSMYFRMILNRRNRNYLLDHLIK